MSREAIHRSRSYPVLGPLLFGVLIASMLAPVPGSTAAATALARAAPGAHWRPSPAIRQAERNRVRMLTAQSQPSTVQVDLNTSGGQPNGNAAGEFSISDDGRYVAFDSTASDLVSGDTNGAEDVFVYDATLNTTTLLSVTSGGVQGNGASYFPSISGDGHLIAFVSLATNLVSGDTNAAADVFLKDLQTGSLTRVSVDSSGNQATGGVCSSPSVSVTGRYVAFASSATNLVTGDTNNTYDVFVRDTTAGTTTRVSVANDGSQANNLSTTSGPNSPHQVTGDGRYVVFESLATNLVTGDTNGFTDVFVRDTVAGTTVRASLGNGGVEPNSASTEPVVSADGRYVFFETDASNLIPSPPYCNPGTCHQIYERDTVGSTTVVVSVDPGGSVANKGANSPAISTSGRFLEFVSSSTNLGPTGVTSLQLFLHDLATNINSIASVDSGGSQMGASGAGGLSADARYVPFTSSNHLYLRFNPDPSVPPGQSLGSCAACDALAGDPVGPSGPVGFTRDPVNNANGNFYQAETDANLPNIGIPLAFNRSYNSADTTSVTGMPIPISTGWTVSYNVYLRAGWNGDMLLHTSDGQQIHFTKLADGSYVGDPGVRDLLVKNGDSTYTLTQQDQTKETFDSGGNVTSVKDRNSQGLSFSYTSGRMSSISGNAGSWTVTLSYTGGLLTGLALPLSRSVAYAYDASNRLNKVTDLRGDNEFFGYDSGNRVNSITDYNGNVVVQTTYGSDGRVASQVDARGHSLSYGWNAQTQTATFTDARSKVWTYAFSNGTLTKVTDPLGDATQYGYDADINATTVTDARGNTTTDHYDTSGNLTEQDDPSSLGYGPKLWVFNARNDPTSFTDGRSPARTTRYEYDAAGNLTCTLLANAPSGITTCAAASQANKVTYTRDPGGTGLLTSTTDPNGNTTGFAYNAMGEVSTITTQLGYVTRLCYDAAGRMTSKVDPRGTETCGQGGSFTWAYAYNAADELQTVTDPLSDLTTTAYDKDGAVIGVTDANNHLVRTVRDAAHNVSCVIGPDSSATTCSAAPRANKTNYVYDNNDNPTSRTDGNNHTWSYAYDDANRLLSVTSPNSKAWSYSYWPNNLVHVKTPPANGTITYDYDPLDRLTGISYSNAPTTPNVSFGYDANGDRTSMTDSSPASTVNYVFDDLNRMTSATRGSDVFSYSYFAGSQLQQVTYPDTKIVGYNYDSDERLCAVTWAAPVSSCSSPGSTTTTYGYDAGNDLTTKTYPSGNGYVETLAYDNAARFTGVTNVKSGTTLSSYAFGSLDGVGNPQSLTALSGGTTATTYYTYDPYDRLTCAASLANCTGSGLTGLGYTYDPVGNRATQIAYGSPNVTTTYRYNADDKLCWIYVGTSSNACGSPPTGATSYNFSANGNETTAGSTTYAYDLADRMTSATVSGTTTTYAYDGDGNRLSSTTSSTTTSYLWDTKEPLPLLALERGNSGSTIRAYSYGVGLNSMRTGGSKYYYLFDAYSGVANLTSPSGATEWTYGYDPFGTDSGTTKNDPNAPANVMGFDGQLLDPATALYDLRARTYDQATGRFLQVDPVPAPTTQPYAGSYVYAFDRPTVLSDPAGGWAGPVPACPPTFAPKPGIPTFCAPPGGAPGFPSPFSALAHGIGWCWHRLANAWQTGPYGTRGNRCNFVTSSCSFVATFGVPPAEFVTAEVSCYLGGKFAFELLDGYPVPALREVGAVVGCIVGIAGAIGAGEGLVK